MDRRLITTCKHASVSRGWKIGQTIRCKLQSEDKQEYGSGQIEGKSNADETLMIGTRTTPRRFVGTTLSREAPGREVVADHR